MPVELRKRKAPEPAPGPEPKKQNPVTKVINKAKGKVQTASEAKARNDKVAAANKTKASNGAAAPSKTGKAEVGTIVSDLGTFGGEVETNDGQKTTLEQLLDASKNGVVLFTYPKASTPGCKL